MGAPKPTFDLEVRTRIPREQYKTLHRVAEKYHTTVETLVAELVRRGLQPGPKVFSITELWQAGFTDAQIAAELGMTNTAVATQRRRAGLPANKRKIAAFGFDKVEPRRVPVNRTIERRGWKRAAASNKENEALRREIRSLRLSNFILRRNAENTTEGNYRSRYEKLEEVMKFIRELARTEVNGIPDLPPKTLEPWRPPAWSRPEPSTKGPTNDIQ